MKRLLIIALAAVMAFSAAGCSANGSDGSSSTNTSSAKEDYISALLEGTCVTGTDGMMLICDEEDTQFVYLFIGDESQEQLLSKLHDGDRVELEAHVYKGVYPQNVVIINGKLLDSGNTVYISPELYDNLTFLQFLDPALLEKGIVSTDKDLAETADNG